MSHVDKESGRVTILSHFESYKTKGESPLWVTCCRDVSRDITPHLMSFLPSKGPDVGRAWGIGILGVVIRDLADSSIMTSFVGIATMGFDMSCSVAEHTLIDLGAPLHGVPRACTLFTIGMLVIWAILPTIGEVGDSCIEYGRGDLGGERGVVKDAWFESSEHVCASQRMEGIVLIPPCVPIEPFEFCQVLGKIGHFLVGATEMLHLPSQRSVSFTDKGEVDHW